MNANRNNNRRRGRGNNRGSGGGNQGNRIDSRARGNAPQLLEKYKKLAHDASLNGDRVQTEYYLQFADHYFRVIADNKVQKDDTRGRRDGDRDQSDEDDNEQDDEFELPGRSSQRRPRQEEREETADEADRGEDGDSSDTTDDEPNPFIRETRGRRPRAKAGGKSADDAANGSAEGFDPGVLPPSITRDEDSAEKRPARRGRRPRPSDDNGGEALEAVG